ncbi:MAG: hypothetical protein ACFFC3_15500 [Candidatus Odinarchaeota archaeon]
MKIDFLKDILDKDEKILWQKEVRRLNFMPTNRKGKIKKYRLKWYEIMKQYHSDVILKDYPAFTTITNKHLIRFDLNKGKYPFLHKVNISHIYVFRKEFCFLNLNTLTEICTDENDKKGIYEFGLYFDYPEKGLRGDDAPYHWLIDLSKEEFKEVLEILKRVAPQAIIRDFWSKPKKGK